MRIEKGHNYIFRLRLSSYELSALISSARWVADGSKSELSFEEISYLKQVLANYDKASSKLGEKLMADKTRLGARQK